MEKGKRPVGREKHVSGSGTVHKRGEGLHSGPVGNSQGYSDRGKKNSDSDDRGIGDLLGGMNGGSNPEQMIENMVLNEAVNVITKKGRKKSPLLILVAIVVLFLLVGGGGLGNMLFGGGTGASSSSTLLNNYSGSLGSLGGIADGSSSAKGVLDTSVSPNARAKRTNILGGGRDQVTIMVYMCGTDLESKYGMATSDLQEIAKATISDQVNLLVYTGGCEKWKNNAVSNRTNQIYQVQDGGLKRLAADVGSKPMTDPATLSQYIKWGKKNFPADRYDLILWDHGGGSTSGYGYDQLYANYGSMTLDKIGEALKDGGCTFDFVGFDACLMATLETALVVEPYSDYLIASEETEPGTGWYYTNWLTQLSNNTSTDTIEIGKTIVDDFVSVSSKQTPSDQTTLAVIDLAEVKGTVPDKFKNFAQSSTNLIQKNEYQVVSNARSQSKEFAKSSGIDQVDLIDLATRMDTDESKELAKTLKSCVKYNLTSSNVQNAYGISIYFPYKRLSSANTMSQTYKKIGLDSSYQKCITSFASIETAGQSMSGGNLGEMGSLFTSLLGGGASSGGSSSVGSSVGGAIASQILQSLMEGRSLDTVGLDKSNAGFLDQETLEGAESYLDDNQFDASSLMWQTDGDNNKVLELKEEQWDLIQNVELNVFVDDGEGYIDLGLDNTFDFDDDGNLKGDYDGSWLAINGSPVAYYFLSAEGSQDDYKITGRVPVMLNGERGDMILVFTSDDPDGQIAGVRMNYTEGETETIPKGLVEIQEGDTLDFLCDYYSYDQVFQDDYYLGDPLTVEGELSISNVNLTNESYKATYRLTDIYNNHYWTPEL